MWQIGVALISGISAKEVVVSSFCVLFGINNVNSAAGMAAMSEQLAQVGFGPLNAYSMMVFCLLYVPCAATIGTIKRELKSPLLKLHLNVGACWNIYLLLISDSIITKGKFKLVTYRRKKFTSRIGWKHEEYNASFI